MIHPTPANLAHAIGEIQRWLHARDFHPTPELDFRREVSEAPPAQTVNINFPGLAEILNGYVSPEDRRLLDAVEKRASGLAKRLQKLDSETTR